MMKKKGALTDMFVFIILAFVIMLISIMFLYIGNVTKNELLASTAFEKALEGTGENATEIIESTFGKVVLSYELLRWISGFLIVGLALSILMTSYLTRTRPIFFIPYVFVLIISIIVSVSISNAYEAIRDNPILAETASGFISGNYILAQLPVWVTIIGFVAGIIMFVNMTRVSRGEGYG